MKGESTVTNLTANFSNQLAHYLTAEHNGADSDGPFTRMLAAFRRLPRWESASLAETVLKLEVVADVIEHDVDDLGGYDFTVEGVAILRSAIDEIRESQRSPQSPGARAVIGEAEKDALLLAAVELLEVQEALEIMGDKYGTKEHAALRVLTRSMGATMQRLQHVLDALTLVSEPVAADQRTPPRRGVRPPAGGSASVGGA